MFRVVSPLKKTRFGRAAGHWNKPTENGPPPTFVEVPRMFFETLVRTYEH
jgi:hypothetical protein